MHPKFHVAKPAQYSSENKAKVAALKAELTPEENRIHEARIRKQNMCKKVEVCWTCGLDGATLGRDMLNCVKCKASIGRKTRYCSR